MLLAADGHGVDVVQAAGLCDGFLEGVHQWSGWTSVPSGWVARPWRTKAPVSASRITTLQDWVELSIPATSGMRLFLRRTAAGLRRKS